MNMPFKPEPLARTKSSLPAAIRMHRIAAAGRRRARRLPGRRLPGARRGRPSPRLGRRHLDRRDQCGAHRRQRAGNAGRASCALSGRAITANPLGGWALQSADRLRAAISRGSAANHWSATIGACCSARQGFFTPRMLPPLLQPDGTPDATSFYDTSALKTHARAAGRFRPDQRRRNAVQRRRGQRRAPATSSISTTARTRSAPSTSWRAARCRPAFPPIEIEGEYYWDGGLVSNTPLQWVLESAERQDTLAFQVDLWSARGALPRTLGEVATRQKEIQYSSRTRASTDQFKKVQKLRNALAEALSKLPDRAARDAGSSRCSSPKPTARSTTSSSSSTARSSTRGNRRTSNSRAAPWKTLERRLQRHGPHVAPSRGAAAARQRRRRLHLRSRQAATGRMS